METVFHRQDLFIDCIQYHQLYTTTVKKIFFYIRVGNFVLGNKKKKKRKKKNFLLSNCILSNDKLFQLLNIDPEICTKIQKRREIFVEWHTIVTSFACFPLFHFLFYIKI